MATKKSESTSSTTVTKKFKEKSNGNSGVNPCNICRGTGKVPSRKKKR